MSLSGTVNEAHKKMKDGMRSMTMEPVLDKEGHPGGFTLQHNMHDYEHPENGKTYHMKNAGEVAKHIKSCKHCSGGEGGVKEGMRESTANVGEEE
jgi:hypothetical protein